METRTGYKADNASFGRFMVSPLVFKWALQGAYAVQAKAKSLTPVGDGPAHMRDLYTVTPIGGGVLVGRNRRGAAMVENHSPHAAAVEFGNAKSRRRRPLGRAAATVGEFRDTRKE